MNNTLKVQMYDKVNYMCRCYMDRIARFRLDYDFVPDEAAFKKAVSELYEASPVFHSYFKDNHIIPKWVISDYDINDSVTFKESDNIESDAYDFLIKGVDIKDRTQMKIGVFYKGNHCAVCFRWNHMLMDGGGFKQFSRDIFKAYGEIINNNECSKDFRTGSRAYTEVYNDMDEAKKKKAKSQFLGNSVHEKKTLPFSKKSGKERNILIVKKIDGDSFIKAAQKAKEIGATANDMLVAAYIRAAYKIIDCDKNDSMGISCAVDLRRYIKDPDRLGYTNHTTFMPCSVDCLDLDPIETVKKVSISTKKAKNDPFMGLHGLPLLNIGYSTMVYAQAEIVVKLFYNNANLALSNVGKIDKKMYSLDGHEPIDAVVAGGAKVKPCAAVNALTIDGKLRLSMTIQGTDEDKAMVESFFDQMEKEIESFGI